ncbi:hypothetical protein QFC21_005244 [Naganishia friedmannii]|uniref:Uncharacterized protein n=1 Tax=Naganishia friedmannii TaxID=89922 RepID=A0ACC2VCY7_9TREE|nr:hypothetical protein QFC21_005244 [Naganishia friedmannii]
MQVEAAVESPGTGEIQRPSVEEQQQRKPEIWWSNGIFFTGYHRLWSHRAYTATTPLRIALAWMASMGFQGSVKWWVLRHRLHHRFTDSPIHDPYSATKGLWFAHCGWIFFKPKYSRMKLIERDDLESDPGLVLPTLIAKFGWGDAMGGYVWGGLVARLLIWHTTFCINSLAHWSGLQPYTEEVSARGNYYLMATAVTFSLSDWDPTKWIIWVLHRYTPLVPTISTTHESEVLKARAHVHRLHADRLTSQIPEGDMAKEDAELPLWTKQDVLRELDHDGGAVFLLIDGYIVDVGGYLDIHSLKISSSPSTALELKTASQSLNGFGSDESVDACEPQLKDASRAFFGQINNHSQAAKEKMRCFRVAKVASGVCPESVLRPANKGTGLE